MHTFIFLEAVAFVLETNKNISALKHIRVTIQSQNLQHLTLFPTEQYATKKKNYYIIIYGSKISIRIVKVCQAQSAR